MTIDNARHIGTECLLRRSREPRRAFLPWVDLLPWAATAAPPAVPDPPQGHDHAGHCTQAPSKISRAPRVISDDPVHGYRTVHRYRRAEILLLGSLRRGKAFHVTSKL